MLLQFFQLSLWITGFELAVRCIKCEPYHWRDRGSIQLSRSS